MPYKDPNYRQKYRDRNKEKTKQYNKMYELKNRKKRTKYFNEYRKKNKKKINEKRKLLYLKNRLVIRKRSNIANERYYKKNKQKIFTYIYNRMKTDPIFRVKNRLRTRLYNFIKRNGFKKKYKFSEYVGCTPNQLKNHIEKKFTKKMSWANYGKWHIDHIIPLSSANTEKELFSLCHYQNLQPLWAIDNIIKGGRIINLKEI